MKDPFEELAREFAILVASEVARALRSAQPDMIDQAASPLGSRRHCRAVKRRLASGQPGAALVGRKHFLAPDALTDELQRISGSKTPNASRASGSVRADLERELQLLKGGGRRE